jgi:hypothetical protein
MREELCKQIQQMHVLVPLLGLLIYTSIAVKYKRNEKRDEIITNGLSLMFEAQPFIV